MHTKALHVYVFGAIQCKAVFTMSTVQHNCVVQGRKGYIEGREVKEREREKEKSQHITFSLK